MGLNDDPFTFAVSKDGSVRVSRGSQLVVTVDDLAARKLLARLEQATPEGRQQLLARATGNYRRGNERPGQRGR